MVKSVVLPAVCIALLSTAAHAQLIALPTTPPPHPNPDLSQRQEGTMVSVGKTDSGSLGAQVLGGDLLGQTNAKVSPNSETPSNDVAAYARITRDGPTHRGDIQGLDARVNVGDRYQGVQVGKQQ